MSYVKMQSWSWSVQYRDNIFSTDSEYEVWITGWMEMGIENHVGIHDFIVKDVCRADEDSDLFYIYTDEFECPKEVDASGKCSIFLIDVKDKMEDCLVTFWNRKNKNLSNGLGKNPDFTAFLELVVQREKEEVEQQKKNYGQTNDSFLSQQASKDIFTPFMPTFDDYTPEKLQQRKKMKENPKAAQEWFGLFSECSSDGS